MPADPTHLATEIRRQPASWMQAAELLPEVTAELPQPGERVAVIGCGTSWFMALAYASLREEQGGGETDAFAASEFPPARPLLLLDLGDHDRAAAEACQPMPLSGVVSLDAVGLVLAGIELPDWQKHLVDRIVVGALEPRAPTLQPLDQALAGGLVTTAAFPVHQLP